jgi:hypothetical protein
VSVISLFGIEAVKIREYLKNIRSYLCLLIGGMAFWVLLAGCDKSEDEIVVASAALKLDTTAGLFYDHMVLEISFDPNLQKDSSKKGKDSGDGNKGFLIKRTEDIKILPESEKNLSYLNLDRFEDSLAYRNKADLDARPSIGIAERLRVADKKLIFGGKGFDTRDFEELNDGKLSGDFSTYINSQSEKQGSVSSAKAPNMNQKLRPEEKNLIFHSPSTALNNAEIKFPLEIKENQKKEKSNKNSLRETAKIPETLVNLNKNPEELIQLRPKRNAIDLLSGNPDIVKDRYNENR